jgi:hypothetical protein
MKPPFCSRSDRMEPIRNSPPAGSSFLYPMSLLCLWVLAIVVIRPAGEFPINDDWSSVRSLQTLLEEGRLGPTGWGSGGPSLLVHILWGGLFVKLFGFSFTVLRVSTLVMGILGSLGVLVLLRRCGVSPWLSLFGAASLVVNPLYLSQSFTFMTDVPFAAWCILSLVLLHAGVERLRVGLVGLGLLFALLAILTRQIGMVIPVAFVASSFLHPRAAALGRWRLLTMTLALTVIPWLSYEVFLWWVGSTPVVRHEVFRNVFQKILEKGPLDYLAFLLTQLLVYAMGYVAFFSAPVTLLHLPGHLRHPLFRTFFVAVTVAWVVIEALALTGAVDPPVLLYRNVIVDFGIGPILLKDTYILGIQRLTAMPKPLYLFCVYLAMVSASILLREAWSVVRSQLGKGSHLQARHGSFLATFCVISITVYLGIITLTGFHDRYLIPVFAFVILWMISTAERHGFTEGDVPRPLESSVRPGNTISQGIHALAPRASRLAGTALAPRASRLTVSALATCASRLAGPAPALVVTIALGCFSVLATRDFMELKRHQKMAQDFLLRELHVDPCRVDGGFEFNGWHCYDPAFKPRPGLSWWWVSEEDYVIALGELPGYGTVRRFPFGRLVGQSGAIHVLQPETGRNGR